MVAKTAAQKRLEAEAAQAAAGLRAPTMKVGETDDMRRIREEALDRCIARGHSRPSKDKPCKFCLRAVILGDEQAASSAALPTSAGGLVRLLDAILADGAEYDLRALVAKANEGRAEAHLALYTDTNISARIRELRGYGRVIVHRQKAGITYYRREVGRE